MVIKTNTKKMTPIAYDGGEMVSINARLLVDFPNRDQESIDRYRYSIKQTSRDHWAIFEYCGDSRLSKTEDCFIYSGLPSGRPGGFIDETTWPTAEEAFLFLQDWKVRETARVIELRAEIDKEKLNREQKKEKPDA